MLPPSGFAEDAGGEGGEALEVLEGPGGGVHGGDAGADVAGEVLEGFGGGLQAVEEGFGGGVDELALEVAEGEGGTLQTAAVSICQVRVQPEGIALGYGLADVGEGPLLRMSGVICYVFLHLHFSFPASAKPGMQSS